MKKNIKLIVLIAVLTTYFFILHKAVNSDQDISYSGYEREVVLPLGNETSYYPIQNLDRETQLRFLDERITHFIIDKEINKKIYNIEMELRTKIAEDRPDKKIITKLNGELSDLNSTLDQINFAHKVKLKRILHIDSKGFIGRGPVMTVNRKNPWVNFK